MATNEYRAAQKIKKFAHKIRTVVKYVKRNERGQYKQRHVCTMTPN